MINILSLAFKKYQTLLNTTYNAKSLNVYFYSGITLYVHTYYLFLCNWIHHMHQFLINFHFYYFPVFDCSATVDQLKKQLCTLTRLNYNAMMGSLFAKNVITDEQRLLIRAEIGEEKMMYLIVDIIIPSLQLNNYMKYKGFLEAMEESEDSDLKSMAERLGKLIAPLKIGFSYRPMYSYVFLVCYTSYTYVCT